jgi:hypothetical protein
VSRTITDIAEIVLCAGEKARQETGNEPEPQFRQHSGWPRTCTVGPGAEETSFLLQNIRIYRPPALSVGAFDKRSAPVGARR